MPKYAGRKAVVVGGADGLGLAIAKRLVEGGAEVVVTGGPAADLAEAAAEVGPAAHVIGCETADPAAVDALGPAVARRLGGIDHLFVHAENGLPPAAPPGLLRLLREGGSVVLTTSSSVEPGLNSLAPLIRCRGSADEVARTALRLAAETSRIHPDSRTRTERT
ncbi:SDR family NAD(P)-dependent oxidoreductase [Streptomyces kanamyceticus]|uniref:SDR family NAD(P)-dependent oxidoreductase n=1 Tax=Streptomyces kanamyceticus TaxID=1967 RepID=A0A5J6GG85_STRKN|nr:SDR family NAD(P)-dependent oxidoreductase [Streptomyces kanamyceticus]QEU93011.1 SDR family NAD(P)-dependent oxidoreductase [Streptomyces kanamyceticus]